MATKILSWNVNGIRACITKGFWDWYDRESPDIVCLQETKIQEKDFLKLAKHHDLTPLHDVGEPRLFDEKTDSRGREPDGVTPPLRNHPVYFAIATAEKAGYSGVAILSKTKPNKIEIGLGIDEFDREGRTIFADYGKFMLVTTYVPNGGRELERIPFKLKYSDALLAKLEKIRKTQKNIAICGDLNVAHTEIDIKNPKSNANNSGFTPIEREWFTKFLSKGYVDTFRNHYPDARDKYSWWSYRPGVREKNVGWRIDYFCVTKEMLPLVTDATIDMKQKGSDHCPVGIVVG